MREAVPTVWLNGELRPSGEPVFQALDRGLLYGDGLFETLRAYRGQVFRLEAHLARLKRGAEVLRLASGAAAGGRDAVVDQARYAVQAVLRANELQDAYVRITLTRGVGGLPYELDQADRPTLLVTARPFHGYPEELYHRGMTAQLAQIRRNDTSPLANVKSLNYLDNALARARARARGFDEALLLNTRGRVAEASASNVFVVQAGRIVTPPVTEGILPGITRQVVLDLCEARQEPLDVPAFLTAEEAFLTNSLMEVMPLVSLDGRPLGAGRPGPTTAEIAQRYRAQVRLELGS